MTKIGEHLSKRLDLIPAQRRIFGHAPPKIRLPWLLGRYRRHTRRSMSCPADCRPRRPLRT
ncbi:hypothetical protein [Bradyrhizobium sp. CCBAU 11386]|uniref:hypothetical protein n=1 Tax=unclassified Bradyrhizobium TaxID=2631580 RepID=UPI002FE11B28